MKAPGRSADSSHDERDDVHAMEFKAVSPKRFALRNDISLAQTFKELSSGRLEGRKVGSRTIITDRAERAWQDALPKVVPRRAAAETPNSQPLSNRLPAEHLRSERTSRRPSRPREVPTDDTAPTKAKRGERHPIQR
jgi:hypothetical protein